MIHPAESYVHLASERVSLIPLRFGSSFYGTVWTISYCIIDKKLIYKHSISIDIYIRWCET
jgi:hypothetical protein